MSESVQEPVKIVVEDNADIAEGPEEDQVIADESDPVRPEALWLRGVDDLSSRDIKRYLDHYLKDAVISSDQRINTFYLEWINDSSVNVVFDDPESGSKALVILTENYDDVTNLNANDERKAKTYYYETEEQRDQRISDEKGKPEKKDVEFYIRVSFKADKKEKNAKEKSRYYLLHGEPDRSQRPRGPRRNYGNAVSYRDRRDNGNRRAYRDDDEEDLFANKLPSLSKKQQQQQQQQQHQQKEVLGPSRIDEAFNSNLNSIDDDERMNDDRENSELRWKSDKFSEAVNDNDDDDDDDDDLFPGFRGSSRNKEPRYSSRDRSGSRSRSRSRSPQRGGSLLDRITPNSRNSRRRNQRKQRAHNLFD